MKKHLISLAALSVSVLASAGPVQADRLYLAGASRGANSSYVFAGAITPLPGVDFGSGLAIRVWADYLEYSYLAGVQDITASGWGAAVAGVYQFSGEWGWANLSAGIAYRDLQLSTPDPGNRDRGAHGDFTLQADGGFNLDQDWRLRGLAGYTPRNEGYSVQLGVDRQAWKNVRIGIDGMVQGNRNYNQVSGGATMYLQIGRGIELAPAVGVSHSDNETGVYGGITLVLFAE